MGKKTERSVQENLRTLGAWQLGSYFFILLWLTVVESIAISSRGYDAFGTHGKFPWLWLPFAIPGLLLVPSAVIFARTNSLTKQTSIRLARTLQVILFSLVVLLTLPAYSYFSMLWMHGVIVDVFSVLTAPSYFVASILGIVSFPIMWKITKALLPKRIELEDGGNLDLIKQ